jgi:hypothetical protein
MNGPGELDVPVMIVWRGGIVVGDDDSIVAFLQSTAACLLQAVWGQ